MRALSLFIRLVPFSIICQTEQEMDPVIMPGNAGDDQSVMPGAVPAVLPDGNDQHALPSPDDLGLVANNQLPSMSSPNLVLQTVSDPVPAQPLTPEQPVEQASAYPSEDPQHVADLELELDRLLAEIEQKNQGLPPIDELVSGEPHHSVKAAEPIASLTEDTDFVEHIKDVVETPMLAAHASRRKPTINPLFAGALAIILSLGVISGMQLVGRSQDVRQQAYVAPEKQISQLEYSQSVKANLVGRVCPMTDKYVAGTVYFFNTDEISLIKTEIPDKMDLFDVQVPAGKYIVAFVPNDRDYPNYAYTDYVRCGLNPDQCKDHRPLVITVNPGDKIGQIKLCDPQYVQEGLPEQLEYENI